jgi:catechol 2,3-dioxygenase-like lactoylglutathione lyase family enzyme
VTIRVTGFDHVVLQCRDVAGTLRWYCDVLGLTPVRVDEWRNGDAPFPSARINSSTLINFFEGDGRGTNMDHFCLVLEPVDLDELAACGRLDVIEGPHHRHFGALGYGTSVYVRDPERNMVELRHYGQMNAEGDRSEPLACSVTETDPQTGT